MATLSWMSNAVVTSNATVGSTQVHLLFNGLDSYAQYQTPIITYNSVLPAEPYITTSSSVSSCWINTYAGSGSSNVTYQICQTRQVIDGGAGNWYGNDVATWRTEPETGEEYETRLAKAREASRLREVAVSRADQLLLSMLSPEQGEQYQRENHFDLTIGGRLYRMHRGRSGNVQLIEGGKPVARFCAHPNEWTPHGDTLIAQMLMLRTNEAEFLKIANRTSLA